MKKFISLTVGLALVATMFTGQVFADAPDSGATFYQDADYEGYQVALGEGTYTTKQLKEKGIRDNDISSIKVVPGYTVIAYKNNNFAGTSFKFTGDASDLSQNKWNNTISSIEIVKSPEQTVHTQTQCGIVLQQGSRKDRNGKMQYYIRVLSSDNTQSEYTLAKQIKTSVKNKYVSYSVDEGGRISALTVLGVNSKGYPSTKEVLGTTGAVSTVSGQLKSRTFGETKKVRIDSTTYQVAADISIVMLYAEKRKITSAFEAFYRNLAQGDVLTALIDKDGRIFAIYINESADSKDYGATFYQKANYKGYHVSLSEGAYTTKQLIEKGIRDDDISSIKVTPGYTVNAYKYDNFRGGYTRIMEDVKELTQNNLDDAISSIEIVKTPEQVVHAETQFGTVESQSTKVDRRGEECTNLNILRSDGTTVEYILPEKIGVEITNKFVSYILDDDGEIALLLVLSVDAEGNVSASEVLDTTNAVLPMTGQVKSISLGETKKAKVGHTTYELADDISIIKLTAENGSITDATRSAFETWFIGNTVTALIDKDNRIFAIYASESADDQ